MPTMVRCAGCGANVAADFEKISKIRTPTDSSLLGYVHKSPPNLDPKKIFHCHLRAFLSFHQKHPVILIENKTIDEALFQQETQRIKGMQRSVRSGTSGKYASQQRGESMPTNHARSSSIPSSY